jgi:hypothetical protein
MTDLHDLELLLRSDRPILSIESVEEPRIVALFAGIALRLNQPVYCWTLTEGLRRVELDDPPNERLADPAELLRYIKVTPQRGIYLLLDFHPFLAEPLHVRLIKEVAQGYGDTARTLVFVSHALDIPPELRHLGARFSLRLPDRNRILALIREEAQAWQREATRPFRADREAVDRLSRNILGVTESDARRLIREAIRNDGAITHDDVREVTKAKYDLLSPEGAVSFEYDTADYADLAGLDNLKAWLDLRRPALLGQSNLKDRPRGVLLLGVQGGGKSLAAKAAAGRFGVPLLRLDFGAIYDKFYGETERNLRRALQTAGVMAPCVLWLDEIEKGLARGGEGDGLGSRVLGTLLTWMAERKSAVFIVATANEIDRLPPELIRKGRLDEIFFVDLPDRAVRREIFAIHLRRRDLDPAGFDLDLLADLTDGFSGAGIEQAVVSALYAGQARDAVPNTDDVAGEIERTQPLSAVMDRQIAELRAWARGRTVPAHGQGTDPLDEG